jgi:hypothetical protein
MRVEVNNILRRSARYNILPYYNRCPDIKIDDSYKVQNLIEYEMEGVIHYERVKRWDAYRLVNTLNILKSDIPEEIKIHLNKFPVQIENIAHMTNFLNPLK